MTGTLRVGGQDYPCAVEVRDSLRFRPGRKGVKPRIRIPDSILLHWTAAENPASTVHKTLTEKSAGVELIIDRAGIIWQTCDPMVIDAADCGGGAWDARSIGIEIVSYGMVAPGAKPPPLGRDRGVDIATLRGLGYSFREIADQFSVTPQAMRGRGRKPYLVDARRDFCRAASSRGYTTPAIARAIDRDHTTVLHYLVWGQK